jgi:NAD-dependent dihydropyrimidine dehydrogenase PreA subunit
MSKLWYPMIDQSKCVGCLACYNKCKHGVFAVEDCKPKVVYREGCVEGCHGCGNLCPHQAIVYSGDFRKMIKCSCNDSPLD